MDNRIHEEAISPNFPVRFSTLAYFSSQEEGDEMKMNLTVLLGVAKRIPK
jgi:hypothetical protein